MKIFHKNEYIERDELKIDALAPGFQYGMGFFTTLKYINNEFKFLDDHLNRLKLSLSDFYMTSENLDIAKVLQKLMEINQLSESRIKIMVYLDVDNIAKHVIIPHKLVVNDSPRRLKTKLSIRGTNINYKYKSLNYFENIREKNIVNNSDFNDFIYYDENSDILEATSSNIFFIKDGYFYTPPLSLPILNGIYRLQICKLMKENCIEKNISVEKLSEFEACFLTNSIQEIVPVKSINHDGKEIHFDISNKTLEDIRHRIIDL